MTDRCARFARPSVESVATLCCWKHRDWRGPCVTEAGKEILSRSEVAIGAMPHVPTGLGGDDKFVTICNEVLAEDASKVGLGAAIRKAVVVGQIEVGDTEVERSPQEGTLSRKQSVITKMLHGPSDTAGKSKPLRPQRRYVMDP
jgi:hypothetical protein